MFVKNKLINEGVIKFKGYIAENRGVTLQILRQKSPEVINLSCVYGPSKTNKKLDFWEKFMDSCKNTKNNIIIGDLNVIQEEIDVWRSETSQTTTKTQTVNNNVVDVFNKHNFVDIFRDIYKSEKQFSYFRKLTNHEITYKSRIDTVISNYDVKNVVEDVKYLEPCCWAPDHCAIQIIINTPHTTNTGANCENSKLQNTITKTVVEKLITNKKLNEEQTLDYINTIKKIEELNKNHEDFDDKNNIEIKVEDVKQHDTLNTHNSNEEAKTKIQPKYKLTKSLIKK